MAEARVEAILAGDDPLVNLAPSHVTFAQACDEHLRYLQDDRQRKASYLKDCRSIVACYLLPAFGETTPVENITTADVDRLRERLLAKPLAHKTVQKVLVLLGGILTRAPGRAGSPRTPLRTPRGHCQALGGVQRAEHRTGPCGRRSGRK